MLQKTFWNLTALSYEILHLIENSYKVRRTKGSGVGLEGSCWFCPPASPGYSGSSPRQRSPRKKWKEPPFTSKSIPACKKKTGGWGKIDITGLSKILENLIPLACFVRSRFSPIQLCIQLNKVATSLALLLWITSYSCYPELSLYRSGNSF